MARYFPLDATPALGWDPPAGNPHGTWGRHFGARRPSGRWHAGCDLCLPEGENVYAVSDGTVLYAGRFPISYAPTAHVYAVEIDHAGYVAARTANWGASRTGCDADRWSAART